MSRSLQIAVVAVLVVLNHCPALSAALSDLQVAWAPRTSDCTAMFRKKGRTVEFVQRGLTAPTSLIIDGQRARGPRATCRIRSVRARDDVLDLRLGCDTAVMSDSYTLSVRFLEKDAIERFDPSFPEIASRFERCRL